MVWWAISVGIAIFATGLLLLYYSLHDPSSSNDSAKIILLSERPQATSRRRQTVALVESEWPGGGQRLLRNQPSASSTTMVLTISRRWLLGGDRVVGHVRLDFEVPSNVAAFDKCAGNLGKIAVVQALIIDSVYRRRGFGKLLMEALEKFAWGEGVRSLYLSTTGKTNLTVYRSCGFSLLNDEVLLPSGFLTSIRPSQQSSDAVKVVWMTKKIEH
jgi:GNAT superfamily N-acetyltransferase